MTAPQRRTARRGALRAGLVAGALTAVLGACGALPKITPDMALRAPRPPAAGSVPAPLSVERSRAFLDSLKRGPGEHSLLDRHVHLEHSLVGSPLVPGNKVELLVDGRETYRAMLAAIAGAKDHINLETYILEDDSVGRRFAAALLARQAEGVQVNLIYDGAGSFATPKAFFQHLADQGVRVLEFNPINPLTARKGWDVNRRDHRKLMIVDGRVAFVGGVNISAVYSSRSSRKRLKGVAPAPRLPWRDTHLRIEGPVVSEFQRLFVETWTRQRGPGLPARTYFPEPADAGGEAVRAIGSSPEEPYSLIYATLVSAINSAENEVFLTNAYFVPDPQLLAALKNAASRGVDVRLLLPGESDSALVFHAGRAYYRELLRAGVRIFERQAAFLHSKTAVIDGVWSTVGSTNLDWRSFLHNQEINAVVLGTDFGERMRARFREDLQASNAITLETWDRRGLGTRIKERLARLWEYWL